MRRVAGGSGREVPEEMVPRLGYREASQLSPLSSGHRRQLALGIKRAVDLLVSLLGLLLLWPLFLLIALAIRLDSKGPAFFHQERVGRSERPFTIHKFRTLVTGGEEKGAGYVLEKDDPRITRFGGVLRRLALDELPQLLNVLEGDMSLVGPRPTLAYQVARYDAHQRRRLLAKPGMTGWAWIHGGRTLTWPQRIELDVWYVDHWSLRLDAEILWRSLPVLVSRPGVQTPSGPDEISRLD
jgi:undecaprenyl phosphate N,N'-diacetylbacillosamine 1-phosphate transferase